MLNPKTAEPGENVASALGPLLPPGRTVCESVAACCRKTCLPARLPCVNQANGSWPFGPWVAMI